VNTYLAHHVARINGTAQQLGKPGHEGAEQPRVRFWALPVQRPAILCIATGARFMGWLFFEPQEVLGFIFIAHRAGART
jgi:hypothetical protein